MGVPRILSGRPSDYGEVTAEELQQQQYVRKRESHPRGEAYEAWVAPRIEAHAERVAREMAALVAGNGTSGSFVPAAVAKAGEPVAAPSRKRRGTNHKPKDEVDRIVPAYWRADFRRFVATGGASGAFLTFLATNPRSRDLWERMVRAELQGEAAA